LNLRRLQQIFDKVENQKITTIVFNLDAAKASIKLSKRLPLSPANG